MRARAVIVAIVALFLFTGTVSSAACEMMCTPVMQSAACCAHVESHCTDRASIRDTRQCSHPQQEAVVENAAAFAVQLQAAAGVVAVLAAPEEQPEVNMGHSSPPGGTDRSSVIPPLRI